MKLKTYFFNILLVSLFIGCGTTKEKTGNDIFVTVTKNKPNVINNPSSIVPLADHLRKIPGVLVKGSSDNDIMVFVRSAGNTFTQNNEPLFLVNGQQFSGDFRMLSQTLDVNLIQSITVLKNASDTAFYGMRGANGVIMIKLKEKI